MILKNFNKCCFCNSSKIKKINIQDSNINFYVKSIVSDLNIKKKDLARIKTYECQNCYLRFNNPWFNENISRKIYSNIYGQHNNSWQNLLDLVYKKKLPNHGKLFEILLHSLEIKNYAEYNSPFMGLYLNFFDKKYNSLKNKYLNFHKNILNYLSSRQLAGKTRAEKKSSIVKSKNYLNHLNSFKKLIKNSKNKINKTLFIDHSSCNWGINDNFKSVNSKSYALQMFDLELKDITKTKNSKQFDLFGIFHSLDHVEDPKSLLNFALKKSDFVIIYCHNQLEEVSKQHQFSITEKFVENLNKQKIFIYNLTNLINKKYSSNELYFLCSKDKKRFNKVKTKFDEKFKR